MKKAAGTVLGLMLISTAAMISAVSGSAAEEYTAVDILMDHYQEWNSLVMDPEYLSCGAVFLDLDFDGTPELLTGGFSMSGRLTAIEFYRIGDDSVKSMDKKSILNSFPSLISFYGRF